MTVIADLETPALLLDEGILGRNLDRMRTRLTGLGVSLRPHVKTSKCFEVVQRALDGVSPRITVSTLREAEYFLEQGIADMLYAVGIAPGKLAHVIALTRRGARLAIVLDNAAAVQAAAGAAVGAGITLPVLLELDVDGHRSGLAPDSAALPELARAIQDADGLNFEGVMTHAGESYRCSSTDAIVAMAERERAGAVRAADRLRAAGIEVKVVSVGSTPTATFAATLDGVTEVRAGVYMFQDLVMRGLGVCALGDLALSVLVSVIGHQRERGWIITDGGWMALSQDRGTSRQRRDEGYGIVCDAGGTPLTEDIIVAEANQEHGILSRRDGGRIDDTQFPLGRHLRVLPNHACATAAQHAAYHVVRGAAPDVVDHWPRINGW